VGGLVYGTVGIGWVGRVEWRGVYEGVVGGSRRGS